jgi:hypothetical protein
MALGNRPKGERIPYTVTLWVYAVLAVYLLVCSFWLTVKSFAVCVISFTTLAYLPLCEVYSKSAKKQNFNRSR